MTIHDRQLDLWIDGNNSTATSWPNLAPATHSLQRVGGRAAPTVRNSGFNFHRELFFGGTDSRLRTVANFSITAGQSYHVFVVSQNTEANERTLLAFNATNTDGRARGSTLQWNGSNIRVGWAGVATPTALSPANTQNIGIASMNLMNGGASTMHMNGRGMDFNVGTQNSNVRLLIGNGSQDDTSLARGNRLPFNGAIQEIIIIRGNARMSDDEMARIHSYLAIKYGIHLEVGDYVSSDGSIVWNRDINDGFNNNIFGIARDDATRLNQVQSRSSRSNILTLFRASRLETLNNNNSELLADGTFLMLGSNNQDINTNIPYLHLEGTGFESGPIDFKFSFRTALTYRAQVTATNQQTVNMQIQNPRPSLAFVLVSPDPDFLPGVTRMYPINNAGVAMDVSIDNGDYISFGGFEATPGGISEGIILDLWIDGNNSTNNSWPNLASATNSLQQFATNTPTVRNSRFNFHRELSFANNGKLRTAENYSVLLNQAYYAFVVSERTGTGEQILLSYNPTTTSAADARRTSLRWGTGNNTIAANWGSATNNLVVGSQNFGIASMNIMNGGASTVYKNARPVNFTSSQQTISNVRLHIGNGDNRTGTQNTLPFTGSIQEIIVMRRNANERLSDIDIARIHTYLAVKYGIHLDVGNYFASNETVVWDRDVDTRFNNNIFGIGRDDFSGLDQRQAQSANFRGLTIFMGPRPTTLNSENPARLGDMQYLLIGSDGADASSPLYPAIADGDIFEGGVPIIAPEDFNIQSPIFKAQLTGMNTITVGTLVSSDFLYALVSTDSEFVPERTRLFARDGDNIPITLSNEYRYFKYVGFSPGPGGVTSGLVMWLRADDPLSLDIQTLPANNAQFSGRNFALSAGNLSAVNSWSDMARGHHYTRAATGTGSSSANRAPVLFDIEPNMNFQPAVRFWRDGGSATAFLGNSSGLMSQARPNHTAIFVKNNNFGGGVNWVFSLMFGGSNIGHHFGPGYGVRQFGTATSLDGRGHFRWANNASDPPTGHNSGNAAIFQAGATTIAGYNVSVSARNTLFRFNGTENLLSWGSQTGGFDMTRASTLGSGGTNNQRTVDGFISEVIIFDRILSAEELKDVESYLAFKYGVTLRPTGVGRFNYALSGNVVVWEGETADLNSSYVRFYNNIAGVVRDDVARLNLQRSHSTDIGSILYMGVPGGDDARLTECGTHLGWLDHDREAIIWGSNDVVGISQVAEDDCGDFTHIFDRIWYVRKHTQNNRPLPMLVSPRNNSEAQFGALAPIGVQRYYETISPSNDFVLIVADSPEDIQNRNFRMVVPMNWLENQHQVLYTFTEEHTYITFGFRANGRGCVKDSEAPAFTGSKRYLWTQWTSRTNRASQSNAVLDITMPAVDLGDEVRVTSRIQYQAGGLVRPTRGFPRSVGSPERGSLELRRRRGTLGSPLNDVIVTINFGNYPVVPEFTISGLDGNRRVWEEVEIRGFCAETGNVTHNPRLTHMGAASATTYRIDGRIATVIRRARMSASNRNGMVHVAFEGGVDRVEIRYRINAVTTRERITSRQRLFISPITIRDITPLPPVNDEGFAFLKLPPDDEGLTTCETVRYTFLIQNANCDNRTVIFNSTLPDGMLWDALILDEKNASLNTSVEPYRGSRTISINSLFVPGSSTIRLMAIAVFEENAEGGGYTSQTVINYPIVHGHTGHVVEDWGTAYLNAVVNAEFGIQKQKVEIEVETNRTSYRENAPIVFTVRITNPNDEPITDSFLDFGFSEEFEFVSTAFDDSGGVRGLLITDGYGTVIENNLQLEPNTCDGDVDQDHLHSSFSIVGNGWCRDEIEGFTLPPGTTIIRFVLQAPPTRQQLPGDERDENNNLTETPGPFELDFSFSTGMDDPCFLRAIDNLEGVITIPFSAIDRIVTNRHIVPRFLRRNQ